MVDKTALSSQLEEALALIQRSNPPRWTAFLPDRQSLFTLTPKLDTLLAKGEVASPLEANPTVLAQAIRAKPEEYLDLSEESVRAFCGFLENLVSAQIPGVQVREFAVKMFLENAIWDAVDDQDLARSFMKELERNSKKYLFKYEYGSGGSRPDPAMC